jgi:hypothetical protein
MHSGLVGSEAFKVNRRRKLADRTGLHNERDRYGELQLSSTRLLATSVAMLRSAVLATATSKNDQHSD